MKLFVYGTLKKGFGNHRVLGEDAKYIGSGLCEGLEMRSNGGYPYAFPNPDSCIHGEVYSLPDLDNCDRLEGYPHHYDRSKYVINLRDGDSVIAWVYHVDDARRDRKNYKLIEDGVWK